MCVYNGNRWLLFTSISMILVLFSAHSSFADMQKHPETLSLASNEKAVEQAVATLLLADIYAKIGLKASVDPLPGKRANKLAVEGKKDGEVARIGPYANRYPSLLRVDPPYYYLTTAVFGKKGRLSEIASKDDLSNYHVAVVTGIAHAAAGSDKAKSVTIVTKYNQLYHLVAAGRIDFAIDTGINGLAELHRLGLEEEVELVGVITRYELHNILHKRNAALRPKIGATITAMQQSGELGRLIEKYEKKVISEWKKP